MYLLNHFLMLRNGFIFHHEKDINNYHCLRHGFSVKITVTIPKGKHNWLTTESIRLGCNIIEVPMGYLTNIQYQLQKYVEEK